MFSFSFRFLKFECCGVDNYEDFKASTKWDKKLGTLLNANPLVTPIACCKELPSAGGATAFSCAQNPFKEDKNNGNIVRIC